MTKKQKKVLLRILLSSILLIAVTLLLRMIDVPKIGQLFLYLIPYFIIGYDILRKAIKGIKNRQVFDENFLMAIATVGAIVLGEYLEGVAVMLFYQIGELFQSYAVSKSRKNISELMDIRPDYANIQKDGQLIQVDPDEVEVGSMIVVQPGEKIPIDGVVIEGESTINTSALTGESLPREVGPEAEVVSGCINLTGVLQVRTTKEFGESTVSKILDMVENASSLKSKSEDFITKFARVYTPIVCYSALALAVLPPLFLAVILRGEPNVSQWFYRALTFLVISCPCALVISIPLSFFAGIGGASREGILIKGSNFLEALAHAHTVVFDKTGTLTQGVFEVVSVHAKSYTKEELIEIAALTECYSSHPISESLQKAYAKPIDGNRIENTQSVSGEGIIATVDKKEVAVGNYRLMERIGVTYDACPEIGTVVHVAVDGRYEGYIVIADKVKATSKQAVLGLKKAGVKRTVMFTGDAKAVAEQVGKQLGIQEVHSQMLPLDKVEQIENLLSCAGENQKVVFVGDGINDAPVLSRADIGIAMGAMGSDAAIEAADIVLMDDDPEKLRKAIRISRKCIRIVYQNIFFAIGVKIICLLLGAVGIANMWFAIFADVGVMVLAVLNAIRALSDGVVRNRKMAEPCE